MTICVQISATTYRVVIRERLEARLVVILQERARHHLPILVGRLSRPHVRCECREVSGRVLEPGDQSGPGRVVEHAVDDLCATQWMSRRRDGWRVCTGSLPV